VDKKINVEPIFLFIIFFAILWAGIANLWDFKISHDFPFGYMASDTFQHQVRAESIKQMGNYRYEAPYISAGFTDAVGFYPPIIYNLAIIFSDASGIETYDAIYLLVFIIIALSVLLFYFLMKKVGENIAILALPLVFLLFSKGPGLGPYASITWGNWPAFIGHFFLICFFWYLTNKDIKESWLFLSIFASSLALAHTAEFIFAGLFFAIFLVSQIMRKQFTKEIVIDYAKAGIVFFALSVYYLIIFKYTWLAKQGSDPLAVIIRTTTDPAFYLPDFGAFLVFIIGGMLLAVFMLRKNLSIPLLAAFFMLLIGMGNYYGFVRHAFRTRTMWPLYLSIFLGISLYFLLKNIKGWRAEYSMAVAILLSVFVMGFVKLPYVPYAERFTSSGIMDPYHWEALTWLRNNVPEDQDILFLYGDIYSQNALLRDSFHPPYMVKVGQYVSLLQNRTIRRNMPIDLLGDHHGVLYAYRKSFFDFGYHAEEKGVDYFYNSERDICNFDYIVLDKLSQQPVLAQYNLLIASKLINTTMQPVFDNQVTAILKNNNKGAECIQDETF